MVCVTIINSNKKIDYSCFEGHPSIHGMFALENQKKTMVEKSNRYMASGFEVKILQPISPLSIGVWHTEAMENLFDDGPIYINYSSNYNNLSLYITSQNQLKCR